MSHRLISDPSGTVWQVWPVRPASRVGERGPALAPEYAAGWLAFEQVGTGGESIPEKARCRPIPEGWEDAPEAAVVAWLDAAERVAARPTPGRLRESAPPVRPTPAVPPGADTTSGGTA